MKCISKKIVSLIICFCLVISLTACDFEAEEETVISQEQRSYNIYSKFHSANEVFLAPYTKDKDLCITVGEVERSGYTTEDLNKASGLFDVNNREVLEAHNIFERLYPASTTKIMTAYLALKYGNLDDEVTVSETAMELDPDSSVCGLRIGDRLSLKDLLYGLLLSSGNDAANVIAEYIGGTIPEFVNMMNQTAQELFMTGTHYVNAHGLHDDDHYTTVYDLYIIMNECIKNDTFNTIIDTPEYTAQVLHKNEEYQMLNFSATNYYFLGQTDLPSNVTVMGGKTGTTDEAGPCLVLLSRDPAGNPYISIILKSYNKSQLYNKMTELLNTIN